MEKINTSSAASGDILKEAFQALQILEGVRLDESQQEKKNFEILHNAFKKMKGLNNDQLPEYVNLQRQIVKYLSTPSYTNYYKVHDKKLTKNTIKRCVVDPFCEKFMKLNENQVVEIARHASQLSVFETLNATLIDVDEHNFLSETLKSDLKPFLRDYIQLLEKGLRSIPESQLGKLHALLTKCNFADEPEDQDIDSHNKVKLQQLFNQKKVGKISRYIRELINLDSEVRADKKLVRKLFEDKQGYAQFIQTNSEWILDKASLHEFTKDEVHGFLIYLQKNAHILSQGNRDLPGKFDLQVRRFISEQQAKNIQIKDIMNFTSIFEQFKPEVKQAQIEKAKSQAAKQKEIAQAVRGSGIPGILKKAQKNYSIEQFIDQVVIAFSDISKAQYNDLDQEVSDQLHQVFKQQLGIIELQSQLFQLLDSRLGTYKTPFQARNYKKVILSLQKSKILNTAEINVLFVKANRFLSKDSVKKEKTNIKNEIKAQFIVGEYSNEGRVYVKNEQLVESVQSDEVQQKPQPKYYKKQINDGGGNDPKFDDITSSEFEDVTDSEEDDPVKSQLKFKRKRAEDPRNRVYLQHYRETQEQEQAEKYTSVKLMHTIDFKSSPKGAKKLLEIEGLVKMIYKEQCVSMQDLALRDKVINNIKNAFKNCSDREYPQILTGEIKVSGFGSCQNGTWNVEHSDIDVTAVIQDKLAYNQHQLLKMCAKVVKSVAKEGTLMLVPASRIPILKFTEKETGLEVDFNVNNILAIHNSDLIYTYCQIDQRFHIMSMFIKHWAKQVDIIGAAYGYLSSYALTLMIISFLQSRSPPVLPCLQEKKVRDRQHKRTVSYPVPIDLLESKRRRTGNSNKAKDPAKQVYCLTETDTFFEGDFKVIQEYYIPKEGGRNTKSVAELLYEFFFFYVYQFNCHERVIDVKNGGGFSPKCSRDRYPFSIVDPFEPTRNPGCSVYMNSDAHRIIMMQFKNALDRFRFD